MSHRALLVAHQWHDAAPSIAHKITEILASHGWQVLRVEEDDGASFDLAIVLGGDGTFLKAADAVRGRGVPLLAFNLGHVGFLAQADASELEDVIAHVLEGDYQLEDRASVAVKVFSRDGRLAHEDWALNEATIERTAWRAMLEIAVAIDGRPLSVFGSDGAVIATPTGSTAHAFSAGGPVVWPDVDALLFVPLAAHALFARPLVVSPASVIEVEILRRSRAGAVCSFDGRRMYPLEPGDRVEVRRSPEPVRVVRLDGELFAERLVTKFSLPVAGWRGEKGQD